MTILIPRRGSPVHYVFAVAYTVIGGVAILGALTHGAFEPASKRGADVRRTMEWLLERFGPEAVIVACAFFAVAGAAFHLCLADPDNSAT
ncbi:hypothetical protein [Marivita sp. XM-24bin2]|jgi:hypothetical protein|uniref:hypothetical protein n=1 Tax=unclassified Marivita TaxID=2632480 RepID=UPI000D794213|nr:hypothetical protein [Marivita sp. XM-24bin2]MCR9108486.1 hypothetical protein [Paracoccaceae bacterium]PWL33876.1 MAG: hypothetical protein DCO97_17320 [Marivita sp. XM-24bin2]